jgi:hypothetical protein
MPTSLDRKKDPCCFRKQRESVINIDIKTFVLAIRACFKGRIIYILTNSAKNEANEDEYKTEYVFLPH